MNQDVVRLRQHWTATETLDYLRSLEDVETFYYLYVVDEAQRLLGLLRLRALVLAKPDTTIDKLMLAEDTLAVHYDASSCLAMFSVVALHCSVLLCYSLLPCLCFAVLCYAMICSAMIGWALVCYALLV